MGQKHATCTLVELMQIGKDSSGPTPVLQRPPEAFHGMEMVSTPRWQDLR
jgi:hypothetical protein